MGTTEKRKIRRSRAPRAHTMGHIMTTTFAAQIAAMTTADIRFRCVNHSSSFARRMYAAELARRSA